MPKPDKARQGAMMVRSVLLWSWFPLGLKDCISKEEAKIQIVDDTLFQKFSYEYLLAQFGNKCQGCGRVFGDSRDLKLDHNRSRSNGGSNHINNRILLCGPCNKLKGNIYASSELCQENNKRGYMAAPTYPENS